MMRALLAWLVIISTIAYAYLGSFAYFSDSVSIMISLQTEPSRPQIRCDNLTLIHCQCHYYLLSGFVVNTSGNVTLNKIYLRGKGWELKGVILDNSVIFVKNRSFDLNINLAPGTHNLSLVLYKTPHHCGKVMYIVFYIDGREYPLSVVPRGCHQ